MYYLNVIYFVVRFLQKNQSLLDFLMNLNQVISFLRKENLTDELIKGVLP